MNPEYPGAGRGSVCMQDTLPFLGVSVPPWGRRIQHSPFWAPIRRSGGCPGDEIAKTGSYCLAKTPDCRPIAGFVGSAASKKGPNRPNWRGDNSRNGLLDVEMTERGYGVPVRNVSAWVTLMIGTLTRRTSPPHSPTWEPRIYPVGRRGQEPDPAHLGDEITKTGSYCFRKNPICPPISGFVGFTVSKKGPNGPNWMGDISRDGLPDVKTGKRRSGDPGQNVPDFTGTGDEREENTKDIEGGISV